jgi:hypothetical protein
MTWVVWRQHRAEGLMLLVVLAVLGVFLLITGLEMANSFQQLRQNHCLGLNSKGGLCAELGMAWNNQYGFLRGAPLLGALPLLLGALVGAPLVTWEVEQRTHLLIWTQSITRMRWLTVKLALGMFAGALTRRTVAAIFLTMVLFLAIRVPVEVLWRPNFETPLTVTYSIDQQNPPALSNQDWIVSQGYVDAQGNRSTDFRGSCTRDETSTQCLQANGVQANYISYQPGDRFWTFQWIETGIYVGFSVLALFAAVWLVRRLN